MKENPYYIITDEKGRLPESHVVTALQYIQLVKGYVQKLGGRTHGQG